MVDWSDPTRTLPRGRDARADKFGQPAPLVERDERDQEQHDRVRDVFLRHRRGAVLVRADLFHTIGGFERRSPISVTISTCCWRVHLSGARVVVAPQARARHREELEVRRPGAAPRPAARPPPRAVRHDADRAAAASRCAAWRWSC